MKFKQNICFIILTAFFHFNALSQVNYDLPKLSKIDSIVDTMNLKTEYEPSELAYSITEPFKTDSEKVRAIYYWITQNISYDYKTFLDKSFLRYDIYGKETEEEYYYRRICHTIRIKKGVCEDYALLFQFLCKSSKISCEYVAGYGLTVRPNNLLKLSLTEDCADHAWNAVQINKKWYLIDVTFASGYIDLNKIKFVKHRNDRYYLTPPKIFILDHHPADPKWQLIEKPLNINDFINNAKYNRETELKSETLKK